uniref:Ig-like domain-containing protein n=1 Tax=Sus scrofa TaxID=9823 RepID=A0A8D0X5G5_PIG
MQPSPLLLLLLLLLLPPPPKLLVLWGASLAQDSWYQLELQQNVTVQEGLCVLVPCKFSYPWSSFGTFSGFWFRQGAGKKHALVATNRLGQKLSEGSQGRFFLLGDPQANNCSLSIRDVTTGDSGTYFFQIETSFHQHAYQDRPLSLGVTALTQAPHILMPETLESGRPRRLTCSVPWACEWGTPPVFSWTSAALPTLGPRTPLSSVVTLTPRPQDHGTSLTCQVMFPASGVTVGRTIQLNVTYAPRNVTVSVFQGNRTGKPQPRIQQTLPAIGGAGIVVLLSFCLYLIFRVKTLRKTQPMQSLDAVNQAEDSGPREPQPRFWADTAAEHPAPAGAGSSPGEGQELHYALLRFHRLQPRPQEPEDTHTEYSEIRTHQ